MVDHLAFRPPRAFLASLAPQVPTLCVADSHSEPSCLPAADSSVVLSQDIVETDHIHNILTEISPVRRSAASPRVAPLCSESQARPAKVTRECSTNTRKNQGASESATATTQAAGAERLRRGQLPQCAPRLTSVRHGAVQPLWRPATGRVLRLWRTERYRLKGIFMLYLLAKKSPANCFHSGRDSQVSMSEASCRKS